MVVQSMASWYAPGSPAPRTEQDPLYLDASEPVGDGEGIFSWIHVDDAAAATVATLENARPGICNVVDDEPAAMREWLPAFAALASRPPRRVPYWLARLLVGGVVAWQ